jgi:hypothetical protein
MRPDVGALIALGRLSSEATEDRLRAQERLLAATGRLVLDAEEVDGLLGILPIEEDDAFGLAWSVLHQVEASPEWSTPRLNEAHGYWGGMLRERISLAADRVSLADAD